MKRFGLEVQHEVFGATSYLLPKIFVLGGYRFSNMKGARAFGKGTPLRSKPNNNFVASLVRLIKWATRELAYRLRMCFSFMVL